MCKFDLRLLVLFSFMPVGLHAADDVIDGLQTAGEVIKAAKPVVDAVLPVIEKGAEAFGEGIASIRRTKTKDRVTALEHALSNYVQKETFDNSQKAQEVEIGRVRAKIPTAKHSHGFVQNDPENPLVREDRLQSYVHDQMNGAQGSENGVNQGQMENYVQGQLNDVAKKSDLNSYITKDDMRNWAKARAGQFALGFSSYRLSWMAQALLQSAGMENQYVDLKDIAVPTTTFVTSLAARYAKEMYNHRLIDLQETAQKSLLDTAASAIVITLKNIFFDEQMRDYYDKNLSENQKAGAYAAAVVPVSLIVNMFAQQ